MWFNFFGITPVNVLYDGVYDEKVIKSLYSPKDWDTTEGYVMRLAESFSYGQYRQSVGKFVRKAHVQTNKHWMHGQVIEPNRLK
jgi:hypothetical protein